MSRGEVGVEEGRGGEEKGREIGEGRWGGQEERKGWNGKDEGEE